MSTLRSSLPPLPDGMKTLPIDGRGYPVPWFVTWIGQRGEVVARGTGTPDFRVITSAAVSLAMHGRTCWICGGLLGFNGTFVIGPMCALNRTCAEPPSHLNCADFAARACPFLVNPVAHRRSKGLPDDAQDADGVMIKRNPGVALVWTSTNYRLRTDTDCVLFDVGDPKLTRWYREGRPATRGEVVESIESGLPLLRAAIEPGDTASEKDLRTRYAAAMRLLPAA